MWVKPTKENMESFDSKSQVMLASFGSEVWVTTATQFPRGTRVMFIPKPPQSFGVAAPALPLHKPHL